MPPHDVPEPPADWTCSTNAPNHIAYYHQPTGRSLALTEEPGSGSLWSVKGLAGFNSDRPTWASGTTLEKALNVAVDVMEGFPEDTPETIDSSYDAPESSEDSPAGAGPNTNSSKDVDTIADAPASIPEDSDDNPSDSGQVDLTDFT